MKTFAAIIWNLIILGIKMLYTPFWFLAISFAFKCCFICKRFLSSVDFNNNFFYKIKCFSEGCGNISPWKGTNSFSIFNLTGGWFLAFLDDEFIYYIQSVPYHLGLSLLLKDKNMHMILKKPSIFCKKIFNDGLIRFF